MNSLEIVVELFFNFIIPWLLMIPGAFIRWVIAKIRGSKKTYHDFYAASSFLTGFLGFIVYVVLFILIF